MDAIFILRMLCAAGVMIVPVATVLDPHTVVRNRFKFADLVTNVKSFQNIAETSRQWKRRLCFNQEDGEFGAAENALYMAIAQT